MAVIFFCCYFPGSNKMTAMLLDSSLDSSCMSKFLLLQSCQGIPHVRDVCYSCPFAFGQLESFRVWGCCCQHIPDCFFVAYSEIEFHSQCVFLIQENFHCPPPSLGTATRRGQRCGNQVLLGFPNISATLCCHQQTPFSLLEMKESNFILVSS